MLGGTSDWSSKRKISNSGSTASDDAVSGAVTANRCRRISMITVSLRTVPPSPSCTVTGIAKR